MKCLLWGNWFKAITLSFLNRYFLQGNILIYENTSLISKNTTHQPHLLSLKAPLVKRKPLEMQDKSTLSLSFSLHVSTSCKNTHFEIIPTLSGNASFILLQVMSVRYFTGKVFYWSGISSAWLFVYLNAIVVKRVFIMSRADRRWA